MKRAGERLGRGQEMKARSAGSERHSADVVRAEDEREEVASSHRGPIYHKLRVLLIG